MIIFGKESGMGVFLDIYLHFFNIILNIITYLK